MTDKGRGAMLWSDIREENDLPFWQRMLALPFYLIQHSYHCIKGTPIYVQYGNHELRNDGEIK